jgi:hypothetical protein
VHWGLSPATKGESGEQNDKTNIMQPQLETKKKTFLAFSFFGFFPESDPSSLKTKQITMVKHHHIRQKQTLACFSLFLSQRRRISTT